MATDNKPHLVNLKLKPDQLSDSYLDYIQGGGLFIATREPDYKLGEEVFLKVDLEGLAEPYRIIGKIVWISTQADAQEWPPGIGVQFQDEAGTQLNAEIQTTIAALHKQGA
jgi:Tfp pilus assembly protein PilZ